MSISTAAHNKAEDRGPQWFSVRSVSGWVVLNPTATQKHSEPKLLIFVSLSFVLPVKWASSPINSGLSCLRRHNGNFSTHRCSGTESDSVISATTMKPGCGYPLRLVCPCIVSSVTGVDSVRQSERPRIEKNYPMAHLPGASRFRPDDGPLRHVLQISNPRRLRRILFKIFLGECPAADTSHES